MENDQEGWQHLQQELETHFDPANNATANTPTLQNVVSTFSLGQKLDLRAIAMETRNTEYNPKRFAAVIMRIREPKTTALIFASGKVVITGAKDEDQARLAARKYTKTVAKHRRDVNMLDFKVQNIVGRADVGFPIRLEGIHLAHGVHGFTHYEPEIFPGLVYKMKDPELVLLIFATGKVVITGAKRRTDVNRAYSEIYPVLMTYKQGGHCKDARLSKRKKREIESASRRREREQNKAKSKAQRR